MISAAAQHRTPSPLPEGLDALVHRWMGNWQRRSAIVRRLLDQAAEAKKCQDSLRQESSSSLQRILEEWKHRMRRHPHTPGTELTPALAAVGETARRVLGLVPFSVQLAGALSLYEGKLAEMATGEGKTLTAGIAAVLLAWRGSPVHVVTVNDYLVERDAHTLRPVFEACGLRVGHVLGGMDPAGRREAYARDVTYGTSKEFAADFLRDQLQIPPELRHPDRQLLRRVMSGKARGNPPPVMRGLHSAIVDEADSLLIDEAVTPLIISMRRENDDLRSAVARAEKLAARFFRGQHYQIRSRFREIELMPEGEKLAAESGRELSGIWGRPERAEELIRQALAAREFFHEGANYVVNDGKVVIVDEFTGRPMPDRSWRLGAHQAVEAKDGLEITAPAETIARISFQRFFRLYHRLSGMTGTAQEAAAELWRVYSLPVVRIPPNKPCQRRQEPPRFFATADAKMSALAERVAALHAAGLPVLVGTRTVRASEELAARLRHQGLDPQVLNARKLQEEALIIAQAGQPGRITIATNMAGRGTDIRLETGVADRGGLQVLAAERHEAGRVDRQLYGRSARQGDPGSAQSFVSADDELLAKFCPRLLRPCVAMADESRFPAGRFLAEMAVRWAQSSAQRQAARQRRRVAAADTWLEQSLSFAGK